MTSSISMTITDTSIKVFKALADRSRLALLHCLLDSPAKHVELLAEQTQLAPSTASFHLKKLEDAGLVHRRKEQYYVEYSLNKDALQPSLEAVIRAARSDQSEQELRAQRYQQKVLDTFLKDGRLEAIPVQRKKRQIILQYLLQEFKFGRTYSEKEVNEILGRYHEDTATLRREMIMERLMDRTPGVYWRRETESE